MPLIKDPRVEQGKINRNREILNFFKKRFDVYGKRYEVVEEEIILKYGVSASTITKILKNA